MLILGNKEGFAVAIFEVHCEESLERGTFSVRLTEVFSDNKSGKIDLGHAMEGLGDHAEDHKAP